MIVLDTSVLSRALRRRRGAGSAADPAAERLAAMLRDNVLLAIPGIVVQETLSGIRRSEDFDALRKRLEPFPLLLATERDHVEAARIINRCTERGLAAGTIDALIAAMTIAADGVLFTLDQDFERIAAVSPLRIMG